MQIDRLSLRGFRNYEDAQAQFVPGVNLLVGGNANGKTNLLEAVSYLSTGRSFRTRREAELIRFGADFAELRAQAEEYGRVKAHIADIELSARERADALDAATRAKLQAYIASCTSQCAQVLATLGNTCESVSTALRHADEAVSRLPGAFTTLEGQLDELKKFDQ